VRLVVLTDRTRCDDLPATVAAAVRGGADAVVFREKDLPPDERRALGEQVAEAAAGAELAVASDLGLAAELGATTVHLAAADPWPDTDLAVGRSCHDAVELSDAADHAADYVTVSPVFATSSKPGYGPPLALDGLADLAMRSPVPVLALGGVDPTNAADCLAAGATGVAVMGGVMAAHDPEAAVRDLLAALDAGAPA
jgi:thiamine-phosphate pyrophosphorylase